MKQTDGLCRRRFLEVVGAATAVVGVGAVPGCGAGGATQPTTTVSAGATSSYTAPVWKLFGNDDMIVARDTEGFYAFTNICTHEGCTMGFVTPSDAAGDTSADGETSCGCHGSVFLGDGSVSHGPARTALAHFEVTIANGEITVNPQVTVAASTRVTG